MRSIFTFIFICFAFVKLGAQDVLTSSDTILAEKSNSSTDCLSDSARVAYFIDKGINIDSVYCPDLYCEILDWIGVKYRYGQGTKSGTDCSSFTSNVTRNTMDYNLAGSSSSIFETCIRVEKNELQEGDLVFFKINKPRISHVGVYLQNGKFAHASVHGGVIISDLDEAYYKKYYYCGGRPR
jgi:murein DD-endopeptidase / murein LD-carboxypeptidase